MTTTTDKIHSDMREIHKRAFEHRLKHFLDAWKPADRYEASEFETQLIMLVRQVYEDAQAPILAMHTQLIMTMPMPMAFKP